MKSILISIKPKYVADILNGKKTIEIRKTMPKCDLPIDVYIYCTKDKKYADLVNRGGFLTGMVVAKFTLNKVEEILHNHNYIGQELKTFYFTNEISGPSEFERATCLTKEEIYDYCLCVGYAWHISNLVIFDKPKELSEFYKIGFSEWCAEHPPILSLLQPKECYEELKQFMIIKAPQSWCYVEE